MNTQKISKILITSYMYMYSLVDKVFDVFFVKFMRVIVMVVYRQP